MPHDDRFTRRNDPPPRRKAIGVTRGLVIASWSAIVLYVVFYTYGVRIEVTRITEAPPALPDLRQALSITRLQSFVDTTLRLNVRDLESGAAIHEAATGTVPGPSSHDGRHTPTAADPAGYSASKTQHEGASDEKEDTHFLKGMRPTPAIYLMHDKADRPTHEALSQNYYGQFSPEGNHKQQRRVETKGRISNGRAAFVATSTDQVHTKTSGENMLHYTGAELSPERSSGTNTHIAVATGIAYGNFDIVSRAAGLSRQQAQRVGTLLRTLLFNGHDRDAAVGFSVVYGEEYYEGRKVTDGAVFAFLLDIKGRTVEAYLYAPEGKTPRYYTRHGEPIHPKYIKAPVDYEFISSPFSRARKHPILDDIRPHTGTDFAAVLGTPIRASQNGIVVRVGANGGYGKMVTINHTEGITTRYAHMEGFAPGLDVGDRVSRGQVIGFVGSTGLSTGPHLHYEVRIHGRPVDPMNANLPGQPPLTNAAKIDFELQIAPLITRLERISATRMARKPSGAPVAPPDERTG